jgi:hypothetical protein
LVDRRRRLVNRPSFGILSNAACIASKSFFEIVELFVLIRVVNSSLKLGLGLGTEGAEDVEEVCIRVGSKLLNFFQPLRTYKATAKALPTAITFSAVISPFLIADRAFLPDSKRNESSSVKSR